MNTTEKIIAEVRKYDCLYNKQSESYTKFRYKETLWSKIGNDIGVPASEVKRKFRNLRNSYKRYKRNLLSPENDNIVRKPYKYAEQLNYLEDFYKEEITSCHISESSLDVTTDSLSGTEVSYSKKRKLNVENFQDSCQDPLGLPSSSIVNYLEDFCKEEITSCHISESSLDVTTDSLSGTEVSYSKKRKLNVENFQDSCQDPLGQPSSSIVNYLEDFCKEEITSCHISESSLDVTTDSLSGTEVSYSKKRKLNVENFQDSCQDPLEQPSSCIVTTENKVTKQKADCTMQLFQYLANKISDSNLTVEQKNDIESSVCKLIYSKIAEYMTAYNSGF